jgi:hypothetical protein
VPTYPGAQAVPSWKVWPSIRIIHGLKRSSSDAERANFRNFLLKHVLFTLSSTEGSPMMIMVGDDKDVLYSCRGAELGAELRELRDNNDTMRTAT